MNARFLGFLAGLVCIGAGVYLLTLRARASDSLIQALANGVGVYCIGRGLGLIASTGMLAQLLPKPPETPKPEPAEEDVPARFRTRGEYEEWRARQIKP